MLNIKYTFEEQDKAHQLPTVNLGTVSYMILIETTHLDQVLLQKFNK